MSRAILEVTAIAQTDVSPNTNIEASASIYVYETDGTTRLTQSIYAAVSGGSPLTQPLTANSLGVLVVYADTPQECVVRIGSETATPYKTAFRPHADTVALRPQLPTNAKAPPYGLLGDGTTNETTDLQAYLDAITDNTAWEMPSGTYRITSKLRLSASIQNVHIRGYPGTFIRQDTPGQAGLEITNATNVTIENVNFIGPGTAEEVAVSAATEYGIHVLAGGTVTIRECTVSGFGYKGIHSDAPITNIIECDVTGTGNSGTSNSSCTNITVFGGRSTIALCRVDNASIGLSVQSNSKSKVVDNWVNQTTPPTAIDAGLYLNAPYLVATGNHAYGTAKVSFTANHSVVANNVFNSGGLSLTHSSGGICAHNTIDGGSILTSVDADQGLRPYGLQIHGNHIRRAPVTDAGSGVFTGAITLGNSTKNVTIENNVIEYTYGHGIVAYDAAAGAGNTQGFPGLTIRHNTIRRGSLSSSGTYSAIKLAYGYGEALDNLRVYGNTVESLPSTTSTNATASNGSTTITLSAAAESEKFTPGDLVAGTGIPAGAYVTQVSVTSHSIVISQEVSGLGSSPSTITVTRSNMKFKYALDLSQANNSSPAAVEVRDDNNFGALADYGTGLTAYQTGIIRRDSYQWRHSGTAHGMTQLADTESYGIMQALSATDGGAWLSGLSEASIGMQIDGVGTTEDATRSTAGAAAIVLAGWKKSTTTDTAMSADKNILAVRTGTTTRFVLDSDGDSFQDAGRTLRAAGGAGDDTGVGWTNYDSVDDLRALQALAVSLAPAGDPLREQFLDYFAQYRAYLDAIPGKRLVHWNDGPEDDGSVFVNMSRLTMLLVGAVRQLGSRLEQTEAQLRALTDGEAP